MSYIVDLRNSLKEEKRHMPILQDGSAIIVLNNKGEVLLQSRADRDLWGLPGGCQELKESFENVAIRELEEETNLKASTDKLKLVSVVSGGTRYNSYPNGDVVYNNTVLYFIRLEDTAGEIIIDNESRELKFFDLDDLPKNLMDKDLIQVYKEKISRREI